MGQLVDVDDVFDDRVGEQGLRGLAGLGEVVVGDRAVDREDEALALPDVGEVLEAEPRECPPDGLPLGVEDLGLEHDVDDDASHYGLLAGFEGEGG